jgi:hypothetical protein
MKSPWGPLFFFYRGDMTSQKFLTLDRNGAINFLNLPAIGAMAGGGEA